MPVKHWLPLNNKKDGYGKLFNKKAFILDDTLFLKQVIVTVAFYGTFIYLNFHEALIRKAHLNYHFDVCKNG
jgi:hypothetical protein